MITINGVDITNDIDTNIFNYIDIQIKFHNFTC